MFSVFIDFDCPSLNHMAPYTGHGPETDVLPSTRSPPSPLKLRVVVTRDSTLSDPIAKFFLKPYSWCMVVVMVWPSVDTSLLPPSPYT